jgi:hypothetical protein
MEFGIGIQVAYRKALMQTGRFAPRVAPRGWVDAAEAPKGIGISGSGSIVDLKSWQHAKHTGPLCHWPESLIIFLTEATYTIGGSSCSTFQSVDPANGSGA